jgi:AcrR family transcriptional regulator
VTGGDEVGKLRRLPSGRHGLSPEFVAQNHRERLAAGAIAAIATHGFRDAGVTQIAAAASVSRRTFYDYFSDKEDCYFDTYQLIEEHLLLIVSEHGEGARSWTARVRARTAALVGVLAANPNLVRFTLLAPPAAGGEVVERQRKFLRRLIDSMTEGAPRSRGYALPSDEELEALAGAMSAVLTARMVDAEVLGLADDAPQLVEMLLVPIIGRHRATVEAEKARAGSSGR